MKLTHLHLGWLQDEYIFCTFPYLVNYSFKGVVQPLLHHFSNLHESHSAEHKKYYGVWDQEMFGYSHSSNIFFSVQQNKFTLVWDTLRVSK